MASASREGGAGGGRERDNRRASISKKSASSSTTTSKRPTINTTGSSTKPVPNYLKPTFSSRLDPSSSSSSSSSSTTTTSRTTPRRPTSTPTTTKSALDRRRNFDTRDTKTSRATSSSSSTSSKTGIKPTGGPQRSFSTLSSRSSKPAVSAPSIRRSVSTRVPPVSALPKPVKKSRPKSVTLDSALDIEARDQDPLDSMIGIQDDTDEVLSLADIAEMPCQEEQLGDPVMIVENHLVQNDEKVEALEAKIDDEHNQDSNVEESGEGVVEEEEESTNVEEKHVVVELEEEKQDDEQAVKDESPAKQDMSSNQSGSKKEAQDYNGVIEETASKLMENKRNKVRALAGAFETVISLQDPK